MVALPTVLMFFVLNAYYRFLREADEVQRSIQLNALALGFGGGWLVIPALTLFEKLRVPYLDQGDAFVVMAGLYIVGVVIGWKRYR